MTLPGNNIACGNSGAVNIGASPYWWIYVISLVLFKYIIKIKEHHYLIVYAVMHYLEQHDFVFVFIVIIFISSLPTWAP